MCEISWTRVLFSLLFSIFKEHSLLSSSQLYWRFLGMYSVFQISFIYLKLCAKFHQILIWGCIFFVQKIAETVWNDPNAFIFHSCDEKREIVNNARNQRLCAAFFPLTSIIDNDNAVSLISNRLVAALDPPGSTAFGRIRTRIHFNPRSGSRSGFLSSDPDPLKKALIWIQVAPKLWRVKSKAKCFVIWEMPF